MLINYGIINYLKNHVCSVVEENKFTYQILDDYSISKLKYFCDELLLGAERGLWSRSRVDEFEPKRGEVSMISIS